MPGMPVVSTTTCSLSGVPGVKWSVASPSVVEQRGRDQGRVLAAAPVAVGADPAERRGVVGQARLDRAVEGELAALEHDAALGERA